MSRLPKMPAVVHKEYRIYRKREHSASLDQKRGEKSNKDKLPVKTPLEGQ